MRAELELALRHSARATGELALAVASGRVTRRTLLGLEAALTAALRAVQAALK